MNPLTRYLASQNGFDPYRPLTRRDWWIAAALALLVLYNMATGG